MPDPVRTYKERESCVTTLSPHNVVMLQGHRHLEHRSSVYRDVSTTSVDIQTPRTHTSNSIQICVPGPTTTLQ